MGIAEVWRSKDEREWKIALNHYYSVLNEDEKQIDECMDLISANPDSVRNMTGDEFFDFLYDQYFVWKYTQPNRLVTTRKVLEKNHDSKEGRLYLEIIKDSIFKAHDIMPLATYLHIELKIGGLGVAGASGLLSILFPNDYGTIDQYLVYALKDVRDSLLDCEEYGSIEPENLKTQDCVFLEEVLRRKANELNECFETTEWNPKKVDMVLWAVHRKDD